MLKKEPRTPNKILYGKLYYQQHKAEILKRSRDRYYSKRDEILDRHTEYHKKYILTFNGRYSTCKQSAKCRGYEWTISRENFAVLCERPCFYCGDIITKTKESGLDRVDSSKGYTMDNVVPCCIYCNQAKNNLPQQVFFNHILKMAEMVLKKLTPHRKDKL